MTDSNANELCRVRCAFGLCVKDNAVGLPKVFDNIHHIRHLFTECAVIAYYDRSNDNSLELTRSLGKRYGITTIVLNADATLTTDGMRTVKIARARNGVLSELYTNPAFSDYELFAMMDSNDHSCQGDVCPDVIRRYLTREFYGEWDSLSFARKPYYDLWAYSSGAFQIGCWCYPPGALGGGTTASRYQDMMKQQINATILASENAGKLVEVDSAFCGFALYKKDVFRGCHYNGMNSTKYMDPKLLGENMRMFRLTRNHQKCDCEHRHFHMMAKQLRGAKIMVACDQAFGPSPINRHV
jgi:hypothetical protein